MTPNLKEEQPKNEREGEGTVVQELKRRAYWLLYDFMRQKDSILKQLNLPKYLVPWLRIPVSTNFPETAKSAVRTFNGRKWHVVQVHPQVSFFQSPLLEFAQFVL